MYITFDFEEYDSYTRSFSFHLCHPPLGGLGIETLTPTKPPSPDTAMVALARIKHRSIDAWESDKASK